MEEELFREQELNRLARERAGINREIVDRLTETNNVILSQIQNLQFEIQQRKDIAASIREIGRISRRNVGLTIQDLANRKSVKKITEDIERLENQRTFLTQQQLGFLDQEGEIYQRIAQELTGQILETKGLQDELQTILEISEEISNNFAIQRFRGFADFIKSIPGLRTFSIPFVEAADAITQAGIEAEKQKREILELAKVNKGLNVERLKELGIYDLLGKKHGVKAFELLQEEETIERINKKFSVQAAVGKQTSIIFDKLGKGVIGTILLRNVLAVDTAQAQFNREVGRSINGFETVNRNLTSTVDYIQTATTLTQQFGFAADSAFDQFNLAAATELTSLMGMSAEQAGNFARLSQTTGTSLDDNLETIIDQVGAINVANTSAVTQRRILEDIGNISASTALTFQGNTVEIARAAQQARILGINLQQVDNIAAGLLDIESSIAKEFEAEVISGRELNLERARFFALTNDLNGLTEELAANQQAIDAFATGTRIEQEAIAGALGMSRDEMADMIFQQRLQLGITDEQARKTLGLNKLDFQRLSAQESIAKSVEKIGTTLAIGVAPILKVIADNAHVITTAFGILAGYSFARLAVQVFSIAKAALALAATNPVTAIATIASLGAIYAASEALFRPQKVGDAIIPAGKGPIISTREGGLIQGTANDDIIMAPGVARGGRNAGLSKEDIQAIASAVRDGASRANINLDGGRVSNRLQPALAVNTRTYSV